ncbi:MAG: FMN-binding protein [Prevotella sp.]|jgi:electron transport complex protein RnfG|nr:FMN-binding protein [Prevotella sp.]
MKRTGFIITICCTLMVIATLGTTAIAGKNQSSVMTKMADGTYVVNTTTLASDVKGYRSTTPLNIYIKNGKVEKVEALKNQETPKYFVQVKNAILSKWNGEKVAKAVKLKVDGVTGATMSSDAVKENVKRGLEYYQKNK